MTSHVRCPGRAEIGEAVLDSAALGGRWAVISTIFAFRGSYTGSRGAAVSRIAATSVSFVLCLIYLIFLPFHIWALALLIGLSALAPTLAGRPGDSITAAIPTTVVMILAEVSPHDAWRQPIFRFADTLVGVAAATAALRVIPHGSPRRG